MKLTFSKADEQVRADSAAWLKANLVGEFEQLKYRGGPGDEHMFSHERKLWEQKLAEGGWTCVGWPKEHGGRSASIEIDCPRRAIAYESRGNTWPAIFLKTWLTRPLQSNPVCGEVPPQR